MIETINAIFASELGPIIAGALILAGLMDIAVTRIEVLPLAKRQAELEALASQPLADLKKAEIEKSLHSLKTVKKITTVFGVILITLGFYGLSK